ncbi:hypothetical protein ACJMK2_031657 [Sinanodonta woodiana]|uniref:Uncharacterized protein n=1 Tax=Sinanodonta woodiana TaxID=1069815 RepID=A0ABD3WZH8_SINWO
MGVGIVTNSTVQNRQMMLVFNNTIQKLYLWFENVSKEDGGIYEMKESFYRTNTIPGETEADTYDKQEGTWYLEIYVLGPVEIKKGYVGGNISMEFEKSTGKQLNLYNYDDQCALMAATSCSVSTDSSLYGRLRCATDDSGRMYKITIVNVSQRDAGLYKTATGRNETGRYFFSIEENPNFAVVGDNMTIGWFYNNQGMRRILRVIHPNHGVMMLLHQTNHPQIKGNFQHRLLYSGDTLQNFMSFTLLNVTQSDAGLYTIETLHGNTIPGSKKLNVEGKCTTVGGIHTTLNDVTTITSIAKQEVVTVQTMESQYLPISVVFPVVTATVVVIIAIISLTGCLIWLQRRNKLEAVRRIAFDKSQFTSFATMSGIRRHLSTSPLEEGLVCSLTLSNDLLHHTYAAIPSESGMFDTTGYSTVLLTDVEDDNQGVHFIADGNGLRKMTDDVILIACIKHSGDDTLDSYPSIYSLAKAGDVVEDGYNCIVDGMDTRREPHTIQCSFGKDKERGVLEQLESASGVTPTTIRKHPYVSPSEVTPTHDEVEERKAFSNAMLGVPFTSISTASPSLDSAWCSTDSLSEPDDDKPCVYCITNPNHTIGRMDDKTLVSCDTAANDGTLDSCKPICTLRSTIGCEEHIYKCVLTGNSSSQVSQSIQSMYKPIKKGPSITFRNTSMRIYDLFHIIYYKVFRRTVVVSLKEETTK